MKFSIKVIMEIVQGGGDGVNDFINRKSPENRGFYFV